MNRRDSQLAYTHFPLAFVLSRSHLLHQGWHFELNEALNGNYILPPVTSLIWNLGRNCPNCVTQSPPLLRTQPTICSNLCHTATRSAPVPKPTPGTFSVSQSTLPSLAAWPVRVMGVFDADACSYTHKTR